MKHAVIPTLPDDFGIGQAAVARIQMEVAMDAMGQAACNAFSTSYVPDLVRAAARESFATFRAQYERAKTVREYHR
jgi:hypothetical protein